ncbi:MAG: hypothetical protein ING29_12810 [Azospirillum sp.]|nr:hypothetical protein [Azospirillum sp.]
MRKNDEMVKRAAQFVYEDRSGQGCVPWENLTEKQRFPYIRDAIAAIGALYVLNGDWPPHVAATAERMGLHSSDWNRMIDALLWREK